MQHNDPCKHMSRTQRWIRLNAVCAFGCINHHGDEISLLSLLLVNRGEHSEQSSEDDYVCSTRLVSNILDFNCVCFVLSFEHEFSPCHFTLQ